MSSPNEVKIAKSDGIGRLSSSSSNSKNRHSDSSLAKLPQNERWLVTKAGFIAATGGFIYGYNAIAIGGVIGYVKLKFNMSELQEGLAISIISIGCMLGCLFSGWIADKFGRWRVIQLHNILFVIAGIVIFLANSGSAFVIGRFISGLAAALAVCGDLAYLNEIAPSRYRGRLASLFEVQLVLGTVVGSLAGLLVLGDKEGWRYVMGVVPIIVAVLNFFMMFNLPESPRWLVMRQREEEAKEAINMIFNYGSSRCAEEVENIIAASQAATENSERLSASSGSGPVNGRKSDPTSSDPYSRKFESIKRGAFEVLFEDYRFPLILSVTILFFSMFTGSVVIRIYLPTILQDAGFSLKTALILNVVISSVNAAFVLVSSNFCDKIGRKKLLLQGIIPIAIGMIILSFAFLLGIHSSVAIYLVSVFFTTIGYCFGFGTCCWVLSAEMFPVRVRGKALSISLVVRELSQFIVTLIFNSATHTGDARQAGYTYLFFLGMNLVAFYVIARYFVETKEREAVEILALLQTNRKEGVSFTKIFKELLSCGDTGVDDNSPLLRGVAKSDDVEDDDSSMKFNNSSRRVNSVTDGVAMK